MIDSIAKPHLMKKLFTLCLAFFFFHNIHATTYAWNGGNGDWTVSTNWTPNGVPGTDDKAVISSGTAILGANTTIAELELSGGKINGSPNILTVTSSMDFTSGTVNATVTVDGGATFTINGSDAKTIGKNGILNNATTATWSDGIINFSRESGSIAALNNSGTFNNTFDGTVGTFQSFDEPPGFVNTGTFSKTGGTGTTAFGFTFNNDGGTLNVNSGDMEFSFNTDGFISTGPVNISAGSELQISGQGELGTGASFSGAGQWVVTAYCDLNDDVSTSAAFNLNGNALQGGSSTLTVSNAMIFTKGVLRTTVTINSGATLSISGSDNKEIAGGGVLNNAGTATWSGGTIKFNRQPGSTAKLNNTGIFNNTFDGLISTNGSYSDPPGIINSGTFSKTGGTGTTEFKYRFINDGGTLSVNNGNVLFSSASGGNYFEIGGPVNIAPGSELEFQYMVNLETGASFSGAGQWIVGGYLNINDDVSSSAEMELNGGTLDGGSTLTITNSMIFTEGSVHDATVTINSGATLTLSGSGAKGIGNKGTLNNAGTATWSEGNINFNRWPASQAQLNNTGTFDNTFDGTVTSSGGNSNPPGFVNSGTFSKTGGTGTTDFQYKFNNSGTAKGTNTLSFSNLINTGTFQPGLSPGILTISGDDYTNGTLDIEILDNTGAGTGHDSLAVSQAATLGGTLNVTLLSGFVPSISDSYTILTCGSGCSGTFGTVNFPAIPDEWEITYNANDVVISVVSALPVELIDFKANEKNESVVLEWITASESNNEGFEIERSNDGKDWETLGWVDGNGTTQESQVYQFRDTHPMPGINYYRLRQVDYDGGFEHSTVVSIQMANEIAIARIFPNPTDVTAYLTLFANAPDIATIVLVDNMGRAVFTKEFALDVGDNRLTFDWSHLKIGYYQAIITIGHKVHYTKVVLI